MPTATSSTPAAGPSEPPSSSSTSSSAFASASITTSEQLVKTLRVPQPPANGVSKIDIALEAWQSAAFFVSKKAELLSQWVLEYLCSSLRISTSASTPGTPNKGKNKSKQQKQSSTSTPSELDLKAWELLSVIVSSQINPDSDLSEAAKRSWLSHLANTQPVLALAGALAKQLSQEQSLSQDDRETLLASASSSLLKLLPPATSRTAATNVEAATDAIQAWLDFFGQPRSAIEQQKGSAILNSIVATWSTTLQYGSNAKRNHQHFCNTAVPSLLQALHTLCASDAETEESFQLMEVVRQVAADSLFTEDVQRSMLQAGRNAEVTRSASWKDTKTATSGVAQQLYAFLHDQQTSDAALSSLPILSELLFTKVSHSEALNSIASSSSSSSGSVRETQLSLVRKTMLSEWLFPLLPSLVTSADIQARQAQRAAARKGVLQGIERDSLYVMGCDEHEEWRSFLSTLFDSSQTELQKVATDASPAARSETADHFACLTSLWRLEKSVVEEELVPILAMVAVQKVSKEALWTSEELPTATLTAMDFFRAVASIDVRFRTIPALVNNVLGSIGVAAKLDDSRLMSSLFTTQTFLAELGKLCRDNVTPMQVPDLIHRFSSITANLDAVLRDTGVIGSAAPKSKKQRTSTSSPSKSNAQGSTHAAHALVSQLKVAAQVVQSVQLAPTLRPRSIAAAEELHNALILPCLDACLSSSSSTTYGVAAAALRVRQALLSDKWRYDPSEPVKLDGSLPTESLPCLAAAFDERADALIELLALRKDESAELCGLQFQIVQSLMQRAERDTFLGYGESRYCQLVSRASGPLHEQLKELSTASLKSEWSGCPNSIKDRDELMQVLWLALVTRWAPLFESLSAEETLALLASVLVSTVQTSEDSTMGYISSTALRNASFLELAKWRNHIIAHIQHEVSTNKQLERRLAATAPLWITPNDWVNKSSRGSLVAKLLALDKDIVSAKKGGKVEIKQWTELRNLIARVVAEYATESEISDPVLFASLGAFFESNVKEGSSEEKHAWERSSLAAIQSTTRVLLSRSKNNNDTREKLVEMAHGFRNAAAAENKAGREEITLKMRAAQDVFAILGTQVVSPEAPSAARENQHAIMLLSTDSQTVSELVQTLDIALYHLRELRLLVGGVGDSHRKEDLMSWFSTHAVDALRTIFSHCSSSQKAEAAADRQKLLIRLAADAALELLRCIDTYGSNIPGAGDLTASRTCLAYIRLVDFMPALQDQRRVADELQRIISHLELEQYDSVLSELLSFLRHDAVGSKGLDAASIDGPLASMIYAIGLALSSAPEGTSKLARKYLSSFLAILASARLFPACGALFKPRSLVAAVSALDQLCSNHAMLFRTQDMGAILQLLSTITGPSMADEPSPTLLKLSRAQRDTMKTKLWEAMLSVLSSLIRLRQDLVLSFLPQLGSLLSRLSTLFRRLRSTSGSAKRQLRRDLPAWLDPILVCPLNAEHEARALSRLLSTLVVKNVSLKNRSSAAGEGGKAESLARPFSKHATYILVAYLRSLTASYSTVPAEVRQELEVGMMTVCGIVGHHQRDAAMAGLLDSAGKVLMKRIWSEYEKQRYKGQ
ncbi:hypothetical protein NDA16_002133 [Ustilago loliicola]|nr:hypothetical protein NDA16_002133 [Ustilago loliicola]